ncbi:hypothetical protein [Hallerella succinigenes]|uniref:hypothetical protein n=1 Tax=Hallerella succinigenes TaxID=1896222 RepID=UPI002A819314|nr:hypothetical protein [Hallerella succinigenes]MDY5030076.1 hypothetical protein [Hallerella succinigenes]
MHKFALLPLFAALLFASSANAQVRDLFAEFEEETKTADSAATIAPTSSSSDSSSVLASEVPQSSSSEASSSSSSLRNDGSSSSVLVSEVPQSSSSEAASSSSSLRNDGSSSSVLANEVPQSSSSEVASSSSSLRNDGSSSSVLVSEVPQSSSSEASSSSSSLRNDTSSSSVAVSSSSISRRDILGPTKVSKVYSIDEMKGQYKSPRKALFFSLVIPGSGQLYVGGSTFNYVRGAAYLAIEGALWGGWYYYSVHKYNKQVKRYKKFAKNHYSAYTYESKIHDLYNSLDDSDEEAEFIERYLSNRETYCKSIYGNASTNGCYVEGKELTNDKNHTNHVNGSFSLYNSGSYYSTIAGAAYVLGWDDVEDEAAASALNLSDNDAETVALGTSANWKTYRSMRNKANDYADMQAWFFGGLILNHIVSALDAAWSAHSHNKVLYEEELSWYDKLHFEGGFIPMNSQSMVNVYFNF